MENTVCGVRTTLVVNHVVAEVKNEHVNVIAQHQLSVELIATVPKNNLNLATLKIAQVSNLFNIFSKKYLKILIIENGYNHSKQRIN